MIEMKNSRGVSLIELLISLSILSLIILSSARLYIYNLFSYMENDTNCRIQQDARSALLLITSEVRGADSINVKNSVFEENAYKSILEISGDDVITIKWKYKFPGKKALYREVNGTCNEIISNVEDVIFDYHEDILTITLTTTGGGKAYTISGKAFPRKMIYKF